MGTAMSLYRRERTGSGEIVDVSLYEPLMFIVGILFSGTVASARCRRTPAMGQAQLLLEISIRQRMAHGYRLPHPMRLPPNVGFRLWDVQSSASQCGSAVGWSLVSHLRSTGFWIFVPDMGHSVTKRTLRGILYRAILPEQKFRISSSSAL